VKLAPQDAGTTLLIVPTYQQATKEEEKEKKKRGIIPPRMTIKFFLDFFPLSLSFFLWKTSDDVMLGKLCD